MLVDEEGGPSPSRPPSFPHFLLPTSAAGEEAEGRNPGLAVMCPVLDRQNKPFLIPPPPLAKQGQGLPESERCRGVISQPWGVVLGPGGLQAGLVSCEVPGGKSPPVFLCADLPFPRAVQKAVETAATLRISACALSEPHCGPSGPCICLASSAARGAPAMGRPGSHLCNPIRLWLWRGEGKGAGT